MNRLGTPATLLAIFALSFCLPAAAQKAPDPLIPDSLDTTMAGATDRPIIEVNAVRNQEGDPGGGSGGSCSPNDQCCLCKKAADDKCASCIADNCNEFPVDITGWTKALCIYACNSVKAQDIVKCTTDNLCA